MTPLWARVGTAVYPLVEGESLKISVGQKLTVFFSFRYKISQTADYPIWASLYQRVLGVVNRVEGAQTKGTLRLEETATLVPFSDQMDIIIGSGVAPGIYGLIVELPGVKDAEVKIDDCIEVTAAPGMMEWMGPLLMIAMVGMMAQMTEGME